MYLEHRLSALLQLHLHSWPNTSLHWIGQRQLQDEARNNLVSCFGATFIRYFTLRTNHLTDTSLWYRLDTITGNGENIASQDTSTNRRWHRNNYYVEKTTWNAPWLKKTANWYFHMIILIQTDEVVKDLILGDPFMAEVISLCRKGTIQVLAPEVTRFYGATWFHQVNNNLDRTPRLSFASIHVIDNNWLSMYWNYHTNSR